MKYKGFIPPHRAVFRNNEHDFKVNPILTTGTDLEELHCPSKIKKLISNPNTSNINRKNLVRQRIECYTCFKFRATHAFVALRKHQQDSLLQHAKGHSHQCGLSLCPSNNIEHPHLDFFSNTVETNHSITYNDYVFPECACCGDEFIS